jgi:hypothetical protein
VGGCATASPPESRRLAGFPQPSSKVLSGFASFVIKNKSNETIRNKPTPE